MDVLKREFRLKNFLYNYPNPRVFYCSMWKWPRPVFIIIRLILGLYTTYGLIHLVVNYYDRLDNSNDEDITPLMAFFTVWSYIVLMLHLVLAAVLSIVFYRRADSTVSSFKLRHVTQTPRGNKTENYDPETQNNSTKHSEIQNGQSQHSSEAMTKFSSDNPSFTNSVQDVSGREQNGHGAEKGASGMSSGSIANERVLKSHHSEYESFSHLDNVKTPWYFQISWCLSDIVSVAAPVVTIIFFVALYPNMEKDGVGIQDTNVHVLNFVFVVIDHLVSARPVRLLHIVAPLIYGILYIIFSVIYWSTDNVKHVLYPNVLDWNYPGVSTGVTFGLAFVGMPFLQLVYFGLYQLKIMIHKKLYGCSFNGDLD